MKEFLTTPEFCLLMIGGSVGMMIGFTWGVWITLRFNRKDEPEDTDP